MGPITRARGAEVYNICTGRSWAIRDLLNHLLSLTPAKIEVRQDPTRLRLSDVPILLGDNTKFVKITGWQPTIPFEQTLRDMLDYWRSR